MWDRNGTCILDWIEAIKLKLLCTEVALAGSVETGNYGSHFLSVIPKQSILFLSSQFKEYWKESMAILCLCSLLHSSFQWWSPLTAVLMSCNDDGYVDLSLALLLMCGLISPDGNGWIWGPDGAYFQKKRPLSCTENGIANSNMK